MSTGLSIITLKSIFVGGGIRSPINVVIYDLVLVLYEGLLMRIGLLIILCGILFSCGESEDERLDHEADAQYESCYKWAYEKKMTDQNADKYCDQNWFNF